MLFTILAGFSGVAMAQIDIPRDRSLSTPVADAPAGSETITVKDLVTIAVERNPAIRAAQETAQAKKSLVKPAETLPDPSIVVQSMGDPLPGKLQRGDPSSARTIGVEQEIPFPGKLGLKGKIASIEAQVEELNRTQTQRQVIAELKQAYYDLFVIRKSMEIVRKDKNLLQNFVEIAQTKYQVGQGIQQDVLKAQVEISKLIDRLVVLDQRRIVAEAQINALLDRPPDTMLGKPADITKAELKYSLEELGQLAQVNSTAMQIQEREIDRRQKSVELAHKEFYPDFSAGFTYYDRDANPSMYGWMLKAKVPLYFWRKQAPELDSAKQSLASARSMRQSTSTTVSSQIKQFYILATTSDRLVKLYSLVVVPQASLALESATASYQVGNTDFLTLIDSLTALLEYEVKYYESLGDFEKALAQLEPLVGADLTD